jgi:hypothetical protein
MQVLKYANAVGRPLRWRRFRIMFDCCALACAALLFALWIRSYSRADFVNMNCPGSDRVPASEHPIFQGRSFVALSNAGRIAFVMDRAETESETGGRYVWWDTGNPVPNSNHFAFDWYRRDWHDGQWWRYATVRLPHALLFLPLLLPMMIRLCMPSGSAISKRLFAKQPLKFEGNETGRQNN